MKTALSDPVLAKRVTDAVGEAKYLNSTELADFMVKDHARLTTVVKAANIRVD